MNIYKKVTVIKLQLQLQICFIKILAGLPRTLRAWARAPYSWNMVTLFSFGCHVIDRAYVRMRLQIVRVGKGRLSKGREGCLRRVFNLVHRAFPSKNPFFEGKALGTRLTCLGKSTSFI